MFDKFVLDAEPLYDDIMNAFFFKQFQHGASESAHEDIFFDSDYPFYGTSGIAKQPFIEGLDETGIDNPRIDPFRLQSRCGSNGWMNSRANGHDGQIRIFGVAEGFAFSNRKRHG